VLEVRGAVGEERREVRSVGAPTPRKEIPLQPVEARRPLPTLGSPCSLSDELANERRDGRDGQTVASHESREAQRIALGLPMGDVGMFLDVATDESMERLEGAWVRLRVR